MKAEDNQELLRRYNKNMTLTLELVCKEPENKKREYLFYPDQNRIQLFLGDKKELNTSSLRKKISDINWKEFDEAELVIESKDLSPTDLEVAYEITQLKSIVFDDYKRNEEDQHLAVR